VRSALGIGRVALFRQVSTEGLLLALLGGALGVGLAFGAWRCSSRLADTPSRASMQLPQAGRYWRAAWDRRFGRGSGRALSRATRLPARPHPRAQERRPKGSAGQAERRLLRAVTMVQTALTLALLVGAGLLIRTMMNVAKVAIGL